MTAIQTTRPKSVARILAGRRSDWRLERPRLPRPRLGLHLLGPAALVAAVLGSWPAFQGARGEDGSVALGLYVGAVSILLMAASNVLALRLKWLEDFFGGLDSMYRVHRWAGSLAVVFMFWHVQVEPEIENGIRGATKAVAEQAEDLAGVGELMLYFLIGVSLLRWLPYRFWRLTHKLLGIPYVFACWHFFTAEKPYANGSGWGWWFGSIMLAGLGAYLARVFVRDTAGRGARYRVVAQTVGSRTTNLELAPVGKGIVHEPGQFAFLRVQARGLAEPHPFSIASDPGSSNLRFMIRDLGDWSGRLREKDLVGTEVRVEGPYGRFDPIPAPGQRAVWIAGGVGITPFLSCLEQIGGSGQEVPELLFATRDRQDNPELELLEAAADAGRIRLTTFFSDEGDRFSADALAQRFGPGGLAGVKVALCGPAGLVRDGSEAARSLGATEIETEDFDMRQGFGPDLSVDLDREGRRLLSRVGATPPE